MRLAFFEQIRAIPVLRPLVFYISGWVLAYLYPELTVLKRPEAIQFLLILTLFSFLFRRFFNSWTQIILVLGAFFFIGLYSAEKLEDPGCKTDSERIYLVEVVESPVEKKNSILIKLKLIYCFTDSISFHQTIFLNSYFEKSEEAKILPLLGEECIISMRLIPVKNNGNPYEFDYATWLKRKDIYFTAFVKDGNWSSTGIKNKNILYSCISFRENIKHKILNFRKGELLEEKAVLLAISLGSKELLDPELKSDFADAGAIHIMAVSGLHVGLIWMFIGFLSGFLKSTFAGRMLQFLICLSILWTYACITGLSPSVTRSCLMFSLVSLGNLISRDSSVYNTVLLSAFIQLLIKPDLILDTGFQFSYTAVLSILFFQAIIKKNLKSNSIIINWFYDLISVSIAAQILTFPLAIYYFHQFPVYFILSNIFVIPLVTLLMMVFISSIFFLFVPVIFNFLLSILIYVCGLMIKSVNFIALLPYSVAKNLNINILQMSLLILTSLVILLFIQNRKLIFFKIAILFFSVFFYLGIYKYSTRLNNTLLVFNIPNALVVDILLGNRHFLIHNLDEENAPKDLSYYTQNYWIRSYSNAPEFIHIDSIENYKLELNLTNIPGDDNFIISLGHKNIVFIGDSKGISVFESDSLMENEALIIFDPKFNPNYNIPKIFKQSKFIIAPSCKLYSSVVLALNDSYFLVRESGSINIDID